MKAKLLDEGGAKTYMLVFDRGDEVVERLTTFAAERNLVAAHLTGLGAFSRVTLGFFERESKDYRRIVFDEQVEVMSLVGNVARDARGEVKLHAHVVVGRRDGTAHGGHLIEARVWPTLEVVLFAHREPLRRSVDEETGLPLLDLTESVTGEG
ncbi:MAG TPA: PPC domain-containing DNA-binding protein [Pyrinomonadaceae bacterium]|nr:PPC domain-containing DNA-binding protein [Pyrinomonadaceae bacterium]